MKISKLTIAALLTMGMVLTGCNINKKSQPSSDTPSSDSGSSSQLDPVSKIRVTPLASPLIIGDTLNLDNYVTVVGGEGEKLYSATLREGSDAVVSLEGKTITALAEGEFTVNLAAGEKTASFSGRVMCQLRADLQGVLAQTVEGYAVQQYAYAAGVVTPQAGKINIHHEDYYAGPSAVKNDAGTAWVTGGMLKAENGKTYEFAVDDLETGENLNVRSKILSDFSHWSTQIDVNLDISQLELQVDPDTGEEFFTLSPELPVESGWDQAFSNYVDEYVAALFDITLNSYVSYYASYSPQYLPLVFRQIQLSETQTAFAVEASLFMSTISYTLNVVNGYFIVGDATPDVASVRAYIDNGNAPAAVPFTEMNTAFGAIATAKNYSYGITSGWVHLADFSDATCPDDLATHGYDRYFKEGTEMAKVAADGKYVELSSGQKLGYIEHDSKLYSFANEYDEGTSTWGDTLTAAEQAGKTSFWNDMSSETFAALAQDATYAAFYVNERVEDPDNNKVTFSFDGDAGEGAVFEALMNPTEYGWYLNYILSNGWTSDMRSYFNCELEINTVTNEASFFGYLNWDGDVGFIFMMDIEDIGTTALPDLSGIVYPVAA